jgi:arsenite-transporting ATPase
MTSSAAPLSPTFLDAPSRFLFFTGKGGVGKTALSCATALRLANAGKRVLLVSTDPASNLDEMLGVTLSRTPTAVPGVPGLFALNIDPDEAATAYRARVIDPYRPLWSEAQVQELTEQLAGACTVEIAAFDEFAGLLAGDDDVSPGFDHIIFDTAPTGHTLRLLSLPRAWAGFLESTTQGASCLGPHSGLKMQEARFAKAVAALADPTRATVVLVTRPDSAALREVERTAGELRDLGLSNQHLVLNAVFHAADASDPIAHALEARQQAAVAAMPTSLRSLPALQVPLRPFNMVGLAALRAVLDETAAAGLMSTTTATQTSQTTTATAAATSDLPDLKTLVDAIEADGRGLVMVMGKGGVGKTTIAAAVAVALARRGHDVHLSTSDPAAHVAATVDGEVPGLTVSRIDPARETAAYIERQMATKGAGLDEAGRALLAEDLRSPCYEEVAVFAAFSRIVSQARSRFVVLDTAPTGHTLLLLDATGAYHRQMVGSSATSASTASSSPTTPHLVTPLMRLQDPSWTKVLLVTLPETTPVSEAAQLQEDLRRAHIEPWAWVINHSLVGSGTRDPCLVQRIAAEQVQIERVRGQLAGRIALVPWQAAPPVGPERLAALAGQA